MPMKRRQLGCEQCVAKRMTDQPIEKSPPLSGEKQPDNPFAAASCYCSGYDVYGDLLKHASFIDYLYLLFKLEQPNPQQSALLEGLAIALANPGLRDHSVRAAMSAGVGGSTHASSLIAALSVGAGNLGGGREIFCAMDHWQRCGTSLEKWQQLIEHPPLPGARGCLASHGACPRV